MCVCKHYLGQNRVTTEQKHKPCSVCRHCPVVMFHTLTVESALPDTRMLSRSSMPLVNDWWPINVCRQAPVSALHTRIDVSNEPLTMCTPSNCHRQHLHYCINFTSIPSHHTLSHSMTWCFCQSFLAKLQTHRSFPFWAILGLLLGYLATSGAKFDIIFLLGDPNFP